MPGVATPTEIMMALDKGISLVKFFPSEALGGVRMLEALAAVFGGVQFVPTGGVTAANFAQLPQAAIGLCRGRKLAGLGQAAGGGCIR